MKICSLLCQSNKGKWTQLGCAGLSLAGAMGVNCQEKTLEMPLTKLLGLPLAHKHEFCTKNKDRRVWGMHMSHPSVDSTPCQETYLGPEAQKYYSYFDILLVIQTHLLEKRYCPSLVWLKQCSGRHKQSYYIFFQKLRSRRVIFSLGPNRNKSVETASFHIFLIVLNIFSPAMYVFHFYANSMIA